MDSADFSVPLNTGENLALSYALKSTLSMESIRASAYLQNTWRWERGNDRWWSVVAGARAQHWTYNGQTVASPRALYLTFHPGWKKVLPSGTVIDPTAASGLRADSTTSRRSTARCESSMAP
ncbi:MAG: hypothetical protein IPI81_11385 [Flavobacteriales bacterium]|nr:hypothetical protein [Flavobacteriales bacterium]